MSYLNPFQDRRQRVLRKMSPELVEIYRAENQTLHDRITDLTATIEQLTTTLRSLQEYEGKYTSLSTMHDDLECQYKTIQSSNQNLKDEVQELQEENKRLQMENIQLRARIVDLEQTISGLKQEIHELKAANAAMNADHDQLKADHDQLKADHDQLKADHDQLKADHDQLKADHEQQIKDHEQQIKDHDQRFKNHEIANTAKEQRRQVQLMVYQFMERHFDELDDRATVACKRNKPRGFDHSKCAHVKTPFVQRAEGDYAKLVKLQNSISKHVKKIERLESRIEAFQANRGCEESKACNEATFAAMEGTSDLQEEEEITEESLQELLDLHVQGRDTDTAKLNKHMLNVQKWYRFPSVAMFELAMEIKHARNIISHPKKVNEYLASNNDLPIDSDTKALFAFFRKMYPDM